MLAVDLTSSYIAGATIQVLFQLGNCGLRICIFNSQSYLDLEDLMDGIIDFVMSSLVPSPLVQTAAFIIWDTKNIYFGILEVNNSLKL